MCGICGVWNHPDAARIAAKAASAQNGRGHDSAGLAYFIQNDDKFSLNSGRGLVKDVHASVLENGIQGVNSALAHTRYATFGEAFSQPLSVYVPGVGWLVGAHNGNMPEADIIKEAQIKRWQAVNYYTTTDSEVQMNIIAESSSLTLEDKVRDSMMIMNPSYSSIFLAKDKMVAIRDPLGIRPLYLGMIGGGYIVASEDQAIKEAGGIVIRELNLGEMVIFEKDSKKDRQIFESKVRRECVMEDLYLRSPHAMLHFGDIAEEVRFLFGKKLAVMRDRGLSLDSFTAVPNSGIPSSNGYVEGFHEVNGVILPTTLSITKDPYAIRTFILETQEERDEYAERKYLYTPYLIKDKVMGFGDDTFVRGTTIKVISSHLYMYGAKEIHARSSAPPFFKICEWGIAIRDISELIAAPYSGMPLGEVEKHVMADMNNKISEYLIKKASQFYSGDWPDPDETHRLIFSSFSNIASFMDHLYHNPPLKSLKYLPIEGLKEIYGNKFKDYCWHCLGGDRPETKDELLGKGLITIVDSKN